MALQWGTKEGSAHCRECGWEVGWVRRVKERRAPQLPFGRRSYIHEEWQKSPAAPGRPSLVGHSGITFLPKTVEALESRKPESEY